MAKKRQAYRSAGPALTQERVVRLVRLLNLLGKGPITRAGLTRRLGLGIRGFYRDLEVLRDVGIEVELTAGRYVLNEQADEALERVPFPDPGLTLGEARQLAKGRAAAHRKIKALLDSIEKENTAAAPYSPPTFLFTFCARVSCRNQASNFPLSQIPHPFVISRVPENGTEAFP